MTDFKNIEESFDTLGWQWKGLPLWAVLRIPYYFALRDKASGKIPGMNSHRRKGEILKTVFRGLRFLFLRRDFILFTDTAEHRIINGKKVDKLFLSTFEELSPGRFHLIETPITDRFPNVPSGNPPSTSSAIIDLLSYLLHYFIPLPALPGDAERAGIQTRLNIRVNDRKVVKLHLAYRFILKMWLRIVKPKAIFLVAAYSNLHLAVCAVARELSIPTVEYQHGVINGEHPAYNFYGRGPFPVFAKPSRLFVHGTYVLNELASHSIFGKDEICVVGHPYIDLILREGAPSRPAEWPGPPVMLVTLQNANQHAVIPWIYSLAELRPDWRFILLPRGSIASIGDIGRTAPPNVMFDDRTDFYVGIQACDIHMTSYSSTALEAPVFGKANVMIDLDGLATRYYGNLLPEGCSQKYVSTAEEAVSGIEELLRSESRHDARLARQLVEPSFSKNLLPTLRRSLPALIETETAPI